MPSGPGALSGCIENKAFLTSYTSIPKPKAEWTDEDIEEVHKDKKAMNILFNGLDQDMFDNVINSQTAKEIWDTVQLICEGTEQVRENKMQLLIQQYEYFHFEEGESLNDTFNRFQKLLNGLKLYDRVYQIKDSNIKFLRSLPKEWKPMTVSLRNSQDYKDFTLERLYGILKTYELEMEKDELLEKGKRKGGSVALIADNEKTEARNEEKTMPSLKIGTSKSESSKGKEQVAEVEDSSSQDDSDDVDEHLVFLSRRFAKMKFKKNAKFTKSNKNMDDWAADGADEDDDMEYVNLALMANSDENETSSSSNQVITTDLSHLSKIECNEAINDISNELYHLRVSLKSLAKENTRIKENNLFLSDRNAVLEGKVIGLEKIKIKCLSVESELEESVKKVEILFKQLEREQDVIKAWKTSRDVSAQIVKVQGIESLCENAWKKNKKEVELIDGLSTDVESTDDESYPLKEEKEHPLKAHQLK
ncbi:hypothetical protein AgCh_035369 [Apium graveolens]